MTLTYVLMQNLQRNPLRTALTALAFAFPMAVFVVAISFVAVMVRLSAQMEKELRLGVHDKVSLTNMLPEGIRRKIEALDGDRSRIRAVCGMRWFGGRVPDTQNTLTSLAADADTFPVVYNDLEMSESDIEEWMRDRRAAVTGVAPAEQYGWKIGDLVTLESTVPPYLTLQFKIVKVTTNAVRANAFYFRRDYLEESLASANFASSRCNIFWVKCNSAEDLRWAQAEIDRTFANTPDETKSEDENSFGANFTQAAGNIPGLMRAMAGVVLVIMSLVGGNAMMMSFRERTKELAVFKAIGFQSRRVFAIVLAESLMLAVFGSLLGIVPIALWLGLKPVHGLRFGPMVTSLELSWVAVTVSLVIAVLVGLAAGTWPASQAMRLRAVDALRRVN